MFYFYLRYLLWLFFHRLQFILKVAKDSCISFSEKGWYYANSSSANLNKNCCLVIFSPVLNTHEFNPARSSILKKSPNAIITISISRVLGYHLIRHNYIEFHTIVEYNSFRYALITFFNVYSFTVWDYTGTSFLDLLL